MEVCVRDFEHTHRRPSSYGFDAVAERAVEIEWQQEVWRGSPRDLSDLVAKTAALVGVRASDGDEIPSLRTYISISGKGPDLKLDNVAELTEIAEAGDPHLREARRIYASLGQHSDASVSFMFQLSRIPNVAALSATIRGDPLRAPGVSEEVRRLAARNGQRWRIYRGALVGWFGGLALVVPDGISDSPAVGVLSWIGIGLMALSFVVAIGHPLLVPHFEVVDPSAPESLSARVRRLLGDSGKWVLAALSGAVIYALIEKAING